MSVTAYNKKGQKQVFSDFAWKLLGNNKGEWTEKPTSKVDNTVKKEPPYMGPTKETVKHKVDNTVNPEPEKVNEFKPESDKVSEFMKAAAGYDKSSIKDFLDDNGVKYKAKSNEEELKELLGKILNYDIVKLQKSF